MELKFAITRLLLLSIVTLLASACKEQILIGDLEVMHGFTYTDNQQVSQLVAPGRYTVYLKSQPNAGATLHRSYRLTLVENGKPAAETQVLHIPVSVPGDLAWRDPAGEESYPVTAEPPAALANFTGTAYLSAQQSNQPFNLQLAVTHQPYAGKKSVKRDCKVSVAAFESETGFAHYSYYDGRTFQPGLVRGPVSTLSLTFRERPSYKKISYSESGREFRYTVQLESPEPQQSLASGSAILRVPLQRSEARESVCRPVK